MKAPVLSLETFLVLLPHGSRDSGTHSILEQLVLRLGQQLPHFFHVGHQGNV